jgi:hypothetical protein
MKIGKKQNNPLMKSLSRRGEMAFVEGFDKLLFL